GYLYQVSNQITIGLSESDLIKNVENAVKTICEQEQIVREGLYKQQGINLEDNVMRSFGILLYARKITSDEFMEHMARVKLGVALGILDLSMPMLNQLTELCQPANMCHYGGRKLNEQERDILRANLVREKIKER
ncbi:MAG: ATP--guanido phosphotransferase, partial [Clostridia bacterium]|nr:ATP--guanido phosphotransferase [Clostridia bacterium]